MSILRATAGLTADNSTIWMTFLFVDNGFSGPTSAIALATEDMAFGDSRNLSSEGYGVGVAVQGVGGPARGIGTIVYDNSTSFSFTPEATATFDGPGTSSVHLLGMKVNWNESGTPDEIFVFDITDITTEPLEGAALASATFDWTLATQQSLDVLNIGETQVDGWTRSASRPRLRKPSACPSRLRWHCWDWAAC